ncbi:MULTISPECIES: lysine N(6)-hydroxylase/L-ornithine N(5)-oxygenase family protein [unclassified Nocardia]|uniref:lysine N(6)-hydroxylase/L-ornithine N(5)-oxygenase family protein n=1 Tax=unclassified Nocardia TaxID=2637762 RepID=UPI001CE3D7BF|nr:MULTISPECIES: SidA/IucD/PvdA family monooxygenase [unclassified Nocardia]
MHDIEQHAHYNCVGIGVGPANLSLASLLYGNPDISNLFLDEKTEFSWHDGQQVPNTTLQVSLLKDLVSLADPTNRFSILSYLHSRGRIYHFLNAQFDAMPRAEFRNYLKWAADLNENIAFGERVLEVDFDGVFSVRTNRRTVTADNLSVGVGTSPWVPKMVENLLGAQHFHVSEIMSRAYDLAGKRVCVVGGGQSGAEALLELISRQQHERPRRVSWVSRRRNFFPIDDSPFTNDFYMPSFSDYFYRLDYAKREQFNNEQVLTSDGISMSTLRAIYQRIYTLRFIDGETDLVALYPNREVIEVRPGSRDDWMLRVANSNHPGVLGQIDADVVIWATGFRSAATSFLNPIAHRLEREGDELKIDNQFAVQWDGPADRNIFLHNSAVRQRGLADRNLSLIAWRSRRVMDRLCGVRSDEQLGSFIEWSAKLSPGDAVTEALPR